MAITSLADVASGCRSVARAFRVFNTGTYIWNSSWVGASTAGYTPQGGAAGNTTSGLVVSSSTTGAMDLGFSSGSGVIVGAHATDTLGGVVMVLDRLYHAGNFTQGTTYTLSSQPSYSTRAGGSFEGTQLWAESVSTMNNGPTLTVTYTNELGVTGQSTSRTVASQSPGSAFQIPLAAGDRGVSAIESTVLNSGPGGTYNLFVARPLFMVRIKANDEPLYPLEVIGAPNVDSNMALMAVFGVALSARTVDLALDIVSG